jgi:hypothetical protein
MPGMHDLSPNEMPSGHVTAYTPDSRLSIDLLKRNIGKQSHVATPQQRFAAAPHVFF